MKPATIALVLVLTACATRRVNLYPEPEGKDYSRQLPPGMSALRKLGPGDPLPDIAGAYAAREAGLSEAIAQSLRWFQAPSSQRYFPFEDICTHEHAKQSLTAFRDLVAQGLPPKEFETEVVRRFDVYISVGCDMKGTVLYTGYYSPEFTASPTMTGEYRVPLYRRPPDLLTDPVTGEPRGRRLPDGSTAPYPTRREIEEGGLLRGTELVWLADEMSAYIAHVNGSARLTLTDGRTIHIGYAGKTDRPYVGLGKSLVEAGLVDKDRLSLPAVIEAWKKHPREVKEMMNRNESYVFFMEYGGDKWPSGSLGVRVTPRASLATDKAIYPRAGVVLVDTKAVSLTRGRTDFLRFMLDQDTGGAIRAPGRADIYMGVGPEAEVLAGGQYAEGQLYYFFLKSPVP
ncbi:MAG: MltA domain-containing protein [Planctomycetes bacterium]|jgi:membrane-bound lytic murein transglycosylase A|nr:MltA domain-containing protein [Planctomycetota bacterium]